MELEIYADAAAVGRRAAEIIAEAINTKPDVTLGLATGRTPISTYDALVRLYDSGKVEFSGVTTFNLDEYVSLPSDDPHSYHAYMREHLFQHVNLLPGAAHTPQGDADDLERECAQYEAAIDAAGGIGLQLLGIGRNGHIGFNEPGAGWNLPTHVVELKEGTRRANANFFGGDVARVPTRAISMGILTIMHAHRLLLLASGDTKSAIMQRAIEGAISPDVPASILQLHPDALVLLDTAAASRLHATTTAHALRLAVDAGPAIPRSGEHRSPAT